MRPYEIKMRSHELERYGVENTPGGDLFLAVVTGNEAAGREAIARGAQVDGTDRRYNWPFIYWAAQKKHLVSVRLLLEHGADANARGFGGETPLHAAARWGDIGSIALLFKAGANINALDRKKRSSLFMAAHYGRFVASYLLLASGAEASLKSDGRGAATAHETARRRGHGHIAKLVRGDAISEEKERVLAKYGLSGKLLQDGGDDTLNELIELHVRNAGPQPLRAQSVRDEIMELALWTAADKLNPPEERYHYIARH